jgi:hypothetical protein
VGTILGPLIFKNIFIDNIYSSINVSQDSLFLTMLMIILFYLLVKICISFIFCKTNATAYDLKIGAKEIKWLQIRPSFKSWLQMKKAPLILHLMMISCCTKFSSVRLLGLTLDHKLNFTEHVNYMIKKASRQLNCPIRLSRKLTTDVKLLLYMSFILSKFNYCPAVWYHCGATNSLKLERIQYRALIYVLMTFNQIMNLFWPDPISPPST